MADTITVVAPRPFTDGRALPAAGKWVPTSFGYAYEAQAWRITVHASIAVDAALIPRAARTDDQHGWFSTDVTLIADAAPAVARELFEETARRIASSTGGKAIGDDGVLMPPRMRLREPVVISPAARSPIDAVELLKAEALLRADREPSSARLRKFTIVCFILLGAVSLALQVARHRWRRASRAPIAAMEVPADQRLPFDAAVWKKSGKFANSGRVKMVDDLVERRILIGLTRDEVVDLLGRASNPDATGTAAMRSSLRENDLVYSLGWLGRSTSGVSTILVVRIGHDGRVVAAEVFVP